VRRIIVRRIVNSESKRLYEKCASGPDLMNDFKCLAKRFNAVFNDYFPKFCEWINVSNNHIRYFRNLFRID